MWLWRVISFAVAQTCRCWIKLAFMAELHTLKLKCSTPRWCDSWFPGFERSSPQFGVAVRAAEARAVVHVLVGHQPLQRINRLLTGHAGLPRRRAKALHAGKRKKYISLWLKETFFWRELSCNDSPWESLTLSDLMVQECQDQNLKRKPEDEGMQTEH